MKIEKRVEAVKVKVKEKAVWVKENKKEAAKMALKGLWNVGKVALVYFGLKELSENRQELREKDQQLLDKEQTISELSDEKELYVESIGILQEEVLELQEEVSEDKRLIKKLASDSLRGRRSLGGSMMNSFKSSDSDLDDPQ